MRKVFFKAAVIFFLLFPGFLFGHGHSCCSKETVFDFGNIWFSMSPKMMEDGYINDISFGYMYSPGFFGDISFRSTVIAKNEELEHPDIVDSLNSISQKTYQLYLLPFGYQVRETNRRFMAGAGLYYERINLNEKGFFDAPPWEGPGEHDARVNSRIHNFNSHVTGLLLDVRYEYFSGSFSFSLRGGLVPFFHLNVREETVTTPLHFSVGKHTQSNWGSPYFYLSADTVFFNYLNIGFSYSFASFKYDVLRYDFSIEDWIHPEQELTNRSFTIEGSFLVPLGGDMRFQIGCGIIFDRITYNQTIENKNRKQYLLLSTKKLFH